MSVIKRGCVKGCVKKCTILTNGMVMSFDENDEQIPECQGFILDFAEKLKIGCDENTKWSYGKYGDWMEAADLSWFWKQKNEGEVEKR